MLYNFFILTIPEQNWNVPDSLPDGIVYIKGQKEEGAGGYRHWQLVCQTKDRCGIGKVKEKFSPFAHVEPTRSKAAEEYVWKEDTSVGNRFEIGKKKMRMNSKTDWNQVLIAAKERRIQDIPASIQIRCWNQISAIGKHYMPTIDRGAVVSKIYWGVPGSGKTYRAKCESGYFENPDDVYIKIPTTKFWDGYRGQSKVIIDEFDGMISLSHLKVWCDPNGTACTVETKGGAQTLIATEFWITSNKDWRCWYEKMDSNDIEAIQRRFIIKEFKMPRLPYNKQPQ